MKRRALLGAVVSTMLAGCSSSEDRETVTVTKVIRKTPEGTPTPRVRTKTIIKTPTQTPTATPYPNSRTVGEEYVTSYDLSITVTGIEMVGTDHHRADDGKQIVHVIAEAENQGDQPQSAPHPGNFYLLTTEEQFAYNRYSTFYDNTQDLLPGKTGRGYIEFELPVSIDKSDLAETALVLSNEEVVRWGL